MAQNTTAKKRPKNLIIRALEPADAEQAAKLFLQPSVYRGTLRTPYDSVSATQQAFLETSPLRKSLVAELDGVIVGEATLGLRKRERQRHVADLGMMVHERYHGRGIGGALLDACIDYAEHWAGILRIELEVFVDNAAAISLYRGRGFVVEGIERALSLRDGVYVDAFRMARVSKSLPHPRLTAEDVASRPLPQLGKGASVTPAKKKNWGGGRGSA